MATCDDDKPVVVRVKRKATQPRLHAFFLEINKRTLKRPLLDFQKLSISDTSDKDEIKARKVFVQHVETVTASEATSDIVKLFVAAVADVLDHKTRSEELKHAFKKDNILAKDARFEQIWRSRKANEKELHYKALCDMCHFYDVVCVDVEERSYQVQMQEDTCMEDHMSKQDHYVYDYYAVNNDINVDDEDASDYFPQVQVIDEDFCHGSDESEYDSKDREVRAKDIPQKGYSNESSSAPPKPINDKLVIVRIKRKATQAQLDAFWLEINERPLKRPLLDFEKLSISDSSGKEEIKARKVFVQHMETVTTSEATADIAKLFKSNFADMLSGETKSNERRCAFKKDNRHDQNLSKARQQQEVLAKNARFEQIWRSRRANKKEIHDKALSENFHFYNVVRVDVEERSNEVQKQDVRSKEDHISKEDNYVYDYYTVNFDFNIDDEDASTPFTRVHVADEDFSYWSDGSECVSKDSNDASIPFTRVHADDEDFCYWSDESEYVHKDSNAEHYPRKDYSNEMYDGEEDSNTEDNPQNVNDNDISDEEKYSDDNPRNDYPTEMSDHEEDSNAEDNAQNDYPYEMSDKEADLNAEMSNEEEEEEQVASEATDESEDRSQSGSCIPSDDNTGNYYPYEMSGEEVDFNVFSAEDNPQNGCPYAMSDEEADLNVFSVEDNPQNIYPDVMSEEEEQVESKAADDSEDETEDCPQGNYPNEMFPEEHAVEEEEGVENQVFNESYNEGESGGIIASRDLELFYENENHYDDIYHDNTHRDYYDDFDNDNTYCDYYDDGGDDYYDDGENAYYDDGGGYSDGEDW